MGSHGLIWVSTESAPDSTGACGRLWIVARLQQRHVTYAVVQPSSQPKLIVPRRSLIAVIQ
jgi:hypothetical protein